MLQPHDLIHVVGPGIDRERRRDRHPQHLHGALPHLDLTRRQVRIDRPGRPLPDDTGDPHDVLAAHVDRVVDHALHDPAVVAQVDEGEVLAVLAAAGHPTAQLDRAPDVVATQCAAQVGAHRGTAAAHVAPPSSARTWVSRSARSTTRCSPPARSGRTTAVPPARSSSPMITARVALLRSAAFI